MRFKRFLTKEELLWVGMDLDGTLADTKPPHFELDKVVEGAREALERITAKGFKIVIYTARPWHDYNNVEDWLKENQIPFRRIICGKPLFKYMVDDRGINFNGNWDEVIGKIK